jgi:hypothetical protein
MSNKRYQITEWTGEFEIVNVEFDNGLTKMPNGKEIQFLSMTYCKNGEHHRIDEKYFNLLSPVKQKATT